MMCQWQQYRYMNLIFGYLKWENNIEEKKNAAF